MEKRFWAEYGLYISLLYVYFKKDVFVVTKVTIHGRYSNYNINNTNNYWLAYDTFSCIRDKYLNCFKLHIVLKIQNYINHKPYINT